MSSAPLLQQEMFEAGPRRRVLVAPGCTSHWGVDPSSKRVAVATIAADGIRGVSEVPFPDLGWAARLPVIYETTQKLARDLAESLPPGIVWLEQPSGKQVNHELEFAVGMIAAALYEGISLACGAPARIEMITSSSWKKLAVGRGNIYKPKRGSAEEYGVLAWARLNGFSGSSWDSADAWAIAEAARRDVVLEVR